MLCSLTLFLFAAIVYMGISQDIKLKIKGPRSPIEIYHLNGTLRDQAIKVKLDILLEQIIEDKHGKDGMRHSGKIVNRD